MSLIKKYWNVVSYLIFWVLTTIVNYLVYYPCFRFLSLTAVASNVIAWVVSVLFAYATNKPFVFKSNDWSWKAVVPEAGKFIGCRVGSGIVESLSIMLAVDILNGDAVRWKIIISILVVVMNYFSSKLLVFRNIQK